MTEKVKLRVAAAGSWLILVLHNSTQPYSTIIHIWLYYSSHIRMETSRAVKERFGGGRVTDDPFLGGAQMTLFWGRQ